MSLFRYFIAAFRAVQNGDGTTANQISAGSAHAGYYTFNHKSSCFDVFCGHNICCYSLRSIMAFFHQKCTIFRDEKYMAIWNLISSAHLPSFNMSECSYLHVSRASKGSQNFIKSVMHTVNVVDTSLTLLRMYFILMTPILLCDWISKWEPVCLRCLLIVCCFCAASYLIILCKCLICS